MDFVGRWIRNELLLLDGFRQDGAERANHPVMVFGRSDFAVGAK